MYSKRRTPRRRVSDEESAPQGWQARASPLAQICFFAYLGLVIDASLYPFVGWHDRGIGAFDYLLAPWPRHAFEFDVIVNVVGYFPLGLFAVYALYPRVRGLASVFVTCVGATALSALLEAAQTFLPSRVASRVDLVTNVAGACMGALVAHSSARAILDRSRLRELRQRWFESDAGAGLVLSVLWLGAILYPQALALAVGAIVKAIDPSVLTDLPFGAWEPSAQDFEFLEVAGCGLFTLTPGLLFSMQMRQSAPRAWLLLGYLLAALALKTFATGLTYSPSAPLVWISPGALGGIALGALLLLATLRWREGLRRLLALFALLAGLYIANFMPDNPYFGAAWQDWERGRLLNFYGLALGINLIWPLLALVYLLRVRRLRATTWP